MKKLFYSICLAAVSAMLVVSCSDGTIGDTFAEDHYGESGGTIVTYNNVVNGFFDIAVPMGSFIAFDLDTFSGPEPSNVELHASFRGVSSKVRDLGADFPSTHEVTLAEMESLLNFVIDSVEVGERLALYLKAVNPSGTFTSENGLSIPFSCSSTLAGSHAFVSTNLFANNSGTACPTDPVTGTVTFTEVSSGVYEVSDLGFGQYQSSCWNDGPATSAGATFSDVCNLIFTEGTDQYGLVYTWVITGVSGPELSISWTNNYADGGDVVITREGGADWPALFN